MPKAAAGILVIDSLLDHEPSHSIFVKATPKIHQHNSTIFDLATSEESGDSTPFASQRVLHHVPPPKVDDDNTDLLPWFETSRCSARATATLHNLDRLFSLPSSLVFLCRFNLSGCVCGVCFLGSRILLYPSICFCRLHQCGGMHARHGSSDTMRACGGMHSNANTIYKKN